MHARYVAHRLNRRTSLFAGVEQASQTMNAIFSGPYSGSSPQAFEAVTSLLLRDLVLAESVRAVQ